MDSIGKLYFYIVENLGQVFSFSSNEEYQNFLRGTFTNESFLAFVVFVVTREVLHLVGGLIFVFAEYESGRFLKHVDKIIFLLFILFILFQEFYLHPLIYSQPIWKGVLDTFVWVVPSVAYLFSRKRFKTSHL